MATEKKQHIYMKPDCLFDRFGGVSRNIYLLILLPVLAAFVLTSCGGGATGGTVDTGGTGGTGDTGVVVVPPLADLVVTLTSADDDDNTNTPFNGLIDINESFTFNAAVNNTGVRNSVDTTLIVFRSVDNVLDTDDVEDETVNITALAVGETRNHNIAVTASANPGIFHYFACVAASAEETDNANNCSTTAVAVRTVGWDLVLSAPNATPRAVTQGQSFTFSIAVRNQNSIASAATVMSYYRSDNYIISTDVDPRVILDTDPEIPVIGGFGVTRHNASVPVAEAGTYFYGACVVTAGGENSGANNCSGTVQITVNTQADLTMHNVSPSDATLDNPGDAFNLHVDVRNIGQTDSEPTTLRVYRSGDNTLNTGSDTQETITPALAVVTAGDTHAQTISLTAPTIASTYYYFVCIDTFDNGAGEGNADNNCTSTGVVVHVSSPDLTPVSFTADSSALLTGESLTLTAAVSNQGSAAAGSTMLTYYRSLDSTLETSGDTRLGTDSIAGLAVGAVSASQSLLHTEPDAGEFYYFMCVDTVPGENVTDNNCSNAVQVTVSAAPDLTVLSPEVNGAGGPVTLTSGDRFTLSADVRNTGTFYSTSTTLRYYRSIDAVITTGDTPVGTSFVHALGAGWTRTYSAWSIAPAVTNTAVTYYYGTCVDAANGESNTANQCSAGVAVIVNPTPFDWVMEAPSVDDATPILRQAIAFSATVRNTGYTDAPATRLRLYRSNDPNITRTDTEVGTANLTAITAGASISVNESITVNTLGNFYYGACVESVSGESNNANNCSTGVRITVPRTPDLTVELLLPNATPEAGRFFVINARVVNQGGIFAQRGTTLRFYRSTDSTITPSDTPVGSPVTNIPLIAAGNSFTPTYGEVTRALAGTTYYYGACVDAANGETNSANNCTSGTQVIPTAAP